jgi:hypothetical protein
MKKASGNSTAVPDKGSCCLVQTVAEAFTEEPALEAVKFNRAEQSISVATMGVKDSTEIEKPSPKDRAHSTRRSRCPLQAARWRSRLHGVRDRRSAGCRSQSHRPT